VYSDERAHCADEENTMNAKPHHQQQWTNRYILLVLVLMLWAIYCAIVLDFHQATFEPITQDSIIGLIGPLFVISLFLERALEVFISAWRDVRKQQLQQRRDRLQAAGANLEAAEEGLAEYTSNTRRASFLAGLGAGIVISVAGVRVLYPLIDLGPDATAQQLLLFNMIDIFLTAGLIGGGSDGIHKVMALLLDFVDVTRSRVNASGQGQPRDEHHERPRTDLLEQPLAGRPNLLGE
jgi:hypothetical protein